MTKIKVCGLYRREDISYVNEALPDYAGFILGYPKSHRNISWEKAEEFRVNLNPGIRTVGVFVNHPMEEIVRLCRLGIIDLIQLHGQEDDDYIRRVQDKTGKTVIQVFKIQSPDDIRKANASIADRILLDSGTGCGKTFDWSMISGIHRTFMLAGGLTPENIPEAIRQTKPYGVDLSSGVETDKVKDREKILAAVRAAHRA